MKKSMLICFVSLPVFFPVPALAAGADCHQAKHADEKTLCASRELSELDVEMRVKYHFLAGLAGMGVRGDMQDAQTAWLTQRRQCGTDHRCLLTAYRQRIAELDRLYDALQKPL